MVSCCQGHAPKRINLGGEIVKSVHARDAVVFIAIQASRENEEASVTGTGVTITSSVKQDSSVILTAGHICWFAKDPLVVDSTVVVFNKAGDLHYAAITAISKNFDLCTLEVSTPLPAATIATKSPESGDRVYYSGYPTGYYLPNVLSHFDGYMAGVDAAGDHLYNVPATGGSSGSPVYNSRGEITGIVSAVMIEFEEMTFATGNKNIIDFLRDVGYLQK
tara:strand:+ start:1438 stop:2097 length:660 start_codon:yes stop_codon:yes gene_type:complete